MREVCRCSKGQPLPGGCSEASLPSLASILPTLSSSRGGKTHGPGAPEGSQVTPGIDPMKSTHLGTTESAHTCIHPWEPWPVYPYLENRAAWAPSVWGSHLLCQEAPQCQLWGPGPRPPTHTAHWATCDPGPSEGPRTGDPGDTEGASRERGGDHGCLGSFPTSPGAQTVWNPAPTW